MANPLGALFAFFFKYRSAVFQQGDFTFGAPAPIVIMLIVGAAIAVPAVLSYARVRGKSSPRDRMILRGLRIAALVVLMVCLLRPMLVLNAAVPQRNSSACSSTIRAACRSRTGADASARTGFVIR